MQSKRFPFLTSLLWLSSALLASTSLAASCPELLQTFVQNHHSSQAARRILDRLQAQGVEILDIDSEEFKSRMQYRRDENHPGVPTAAQVARLEGIQAPRSGDDLPLVGIRTRRNRQEYDVLFISRTLAHEIAHARFEQWSATLPASSPLRVPDEVTEGFWYSTQGYLNEVAAHYLERVIRGAKQENLLEILVRIGEAGYPDVLPGGELGVLQLLWLTSQRTSESVPTLFHLLRTAQLISPADVREFSAGETLPVEFEAFLRRMIEFNPELGKRVHTALAWHGLTAPLLAEDELRIIEKANLEKHDFELFERLVRLGTMARSIPDIFSRLGKLASSEPIAEYTLYGFYEALFRLGQVRQAEADSAIVEFILKSETKRRNDHWLRWVYKTIGEHKLAHYFRVSAAIGLGDLDTQHSFYFKVNEEKYYFPTVEKLILQDVPPKALAVHMHYLAIAFEDQPAKAWKLLEAAAQKGGELGKAARDAIASDTLKFALGEYGALSDRQKTLYREEVRRLLGSDNPPD